MSSNRYLIYLFLLLSMGWNILSCANDTDSKNTTVKESLSEAEQYLQDYDSPEEKWGYLDTTGNMVIRAQFDHAREFSEGLAAVNVNGKWGYIDKTGKQLIKPQFRAAYPFRDKIARIQTLEKMYGFINSAGEFVLPPIYAEAHDFKSGLARIKTGPVFQFIDLKGDTVIRKVYHSASDFVEGFARVKEMKYGLINAEGIEIIPLIFDQIHTPSDKLIRFRQDGKYGFLSMNGNELIAPKYDYATDFKEGICMVRKADVSYFVNKNALEFSLEDKTAMGYAGNNLWKVKSADGYWCLVDAGGKEICDCKYELINNFSEGKALYQKDGSWGFMDTLGIEITPAVFPLAWDFKEGKARVILHGSVGYIDESGELVIPPYYFENRDFSEGLARVQVF